MTGRHRLAQFEAHIDHGLRVGTVTLRTARTHERMRTRIRGRVVARHLDRIEPHRDR